MTDTQVAGIRKGDRFRSADGVEWTAVLDAALEIPVTTMETWQARLVSRSGRQTLRLTYRNCDDLVAVGTTLEVLA